MQYFISVARVYDWTVSTPVSLWAPKEHVRVSIMQAGVKSSRHSLFCWSFLLVFFTEQTVINDIYDNIMQNNCSTSLANRLLASRSAFWGTEGTTVLLCREIWDSCTHANTKWATCGFTCMVRDGDISHNIKHGKREWEKTKDKYTKKQILSVRRRRVDTNRCTTRTKPHVSEATAINTWLDRMWELDSAVNNWA